MSKAGSDVLTPEQRKYCMSQIKGHDTNLEMTLRLALWHRGHRYRIRTKLVGKPDLVFSGRHVAIFIDGCFWHKCPIHSNEPRKNASFWKEKLDRNVARDADVTRQLQQSGWIVVRVWEHDIKRDLNGVVDRIEQVFETTKFL